MIVMIKAGVVIHVAVRIEPHGTPYVNGLMGLTSFHDNPFGSVAPFARPTKP